MAKDMCELLVLKKLLEELRIKIKETIKLYHDTNAATKIEKKLVQHGRVKHVEIDIFIKEKLGSGLIGMSFMSTNKKLANIYTKSHPSKHLSYLLGSNLGSTNMLELASWGVRLKLHFDFCKLSKRFFSLI